MDVTNASTLVLEDLKQGLPGLTEDAGGSLRENAMVCLNSQGYSSGVHCEMKSLKKTCSILRINWTGDVTDQMRNTWYDRREASEFGAAGLAILVILSRTKYTVLRRMDIDEDTGMDYWLSNSNSAGSVSENFLQGDARLEVAGRRRENTKKIEKLVRDKLKRSKKSDGTGTPAYVVVVEFSKPVVYFETRMADL